MKELEKIQINLLQLQINKEMMEANLRGSQAIQRELDYSQHNMIGGFTDSIRQINERKKDLQSEEEFQSKRYNCLQLISKTLDKMMKQIK